MEEEKKNQEDITEDSTDSAEETETEEEPHADTENDVSESGGKSVEEEAQEESDNNFEFDSDEPDDDFTNSDEYDDISLIAPYDDTPDPSDALDKARAERKAARRAFWGKIKMPCIVILVILAGIFIGIFSYSLARIPDDRVMDNVYIDTLNVGGLSYEEAVDAINSSYMFQDTQINLLCAGQSFSINSSDIGLLAIPEDSAQKAFNYCKSGNILKDGIGSLSLLLKKHVIMPAAKVDTEKLDEKINEFGNIVLGERKQHSVEYGEDNIATIYSGQTGYNMKPDYAREEILASFDNEKFTDIYVSFESAPPEDMTVERFDLLTYKDPVDAKYEIEGNTVNIVPEQNGRYINKEEAAPLLLNVHEGCDPVSVPFYTSDASVTEQTLKDKLFSATLASYSTSYGGSTSNRCANIARAASLINGTVIAPGGVFSFNNTVGHRTTANGFYTAKEYVDGKSVDGIGGGTCQVSSTLYSAVLYADMSIVERLNHMMAVGYIPLGQDATVSDGGVDFKFKNSSDYPVKIAASTSGATITVSIIGTAWEPAREVKISNSSSQSGKNTVVYSKRYVYSNGELISSDNLNSSTYMPHEPAEPSPAH